MVKKFKFTIPADCSGLRLDKALLKLLPAYSRGFLQSLIESELIQLETRKVKSHSKVNEGEHLFVTIPDPKTLDLKPEKMDLDILYEDSDLLVVNKPAGLVVHPAPGHPENTLVHGLLSHCKDLSDINGVLRPGIVHRLDKDTSGCLVVAKNNQAHASLAKQFEMRSVGKSYRCLVEGKWKKGSKKIQSFIGRHPVSRKKMAVLSSGGKKAISAVKLIEVFKETSLLEVELFTGRTHQIRVHLAHEGFPVLGDQKYGKRRKKEWTSDLIPRQMLHAYRLSFSHPKTAKTIQIIAPIPEDMEQVIQYLKKEL